MAVGVNIPKLPEEQRLAVAGPLLEAQKLSRNYGA